MFSDIVSGTESTPTGIQFSIGDIRFQLSNDKVELLETNASFEAYCNTYDCLFSLCENIDAYDGKLDTAVLGFVNHNHELANFLHISTEELEAKSGSQLKEDLKQGFFSKAWDAIAKFFKMIWNKLVSFFKWITNGFKSVGPKIEAAEKSWGARTPEEKKAFLDRVKVNTSMTEFVNRMRVAEELVAHWTQTFGKLTPKEIMDRYFHNPSFFFNRTVANNLRQYGIELVSESGRKMEEVFASPDPSSVTMKFKAVIKTRESQELKTFTEHGWTEAGIQSSFEFSEALCKAFTAMDDRMQFHDQISLLNASEIENNYKQLLEEKDSLFYKALSLIHKGDLYRMKEGGIKVYKDGLANLTAIYRCILEAIRSVWDIDNRLLDTFRLTEAELIKRQKGE